MAPHSGNGISGVEDDSENDKFIIPTCGPFPCAITTSCPSLINSTIGVATCFNNSFCS